MDVWHHQVLVLLISYSKQPWKFELSRSLSVLTVSRSDNRWRGCGATLLGCNPVIIVTAAHCVSGLSSPRQLRVSCGARRMSLRRPSPLDEGEVRLGVRKVVSHPQYRETSLTLQQSGLKLFR